MAEQIAIQDLKPGMFIVGVIEQNGPVKIRKSGLVTSNEMVQGLAEMGVLSVAIDTEKTVEIELDDSVHVSQTQFVMQANEEKASKDTDTHLSEQFNRSLFMPSLQKVPSAWQYYGTRIAVAALVTVTGFSSGWFASKVPSMLADDDSVAQVSENPAAETDPESDKIVEADSPTPEQGASTAPVANTVESPAAEAVTAQTSQTNQNSPENLAAQSSINSDSDSQFAASTTDTESKEVVSQSPQANADSQVSPELLQRFEQAMADLERESSPGMNKAEFADDGETLEYGDQDNSFNSTDVQRVDQLPARVMTRLPRMSFSAHMYASNPRDRWVKVNGVEMGEGEWLDEKIFIEKIEPQHVILLFEGHQFSMRALSEW